MKWNIVLDSSCDLKNTSSQSEIGIKIVPLKIIVGEREFCDDDNINTGVLLEAMKAEKSASSSACPSPDDFYSCFKSADCSVCITMTGKLSGTYNAARVAKEMLAEKHPEKRVHIVDSKATAGKMVLLKMKAQELIEQGTSFEDICNEMDLYNSQTELVFALGGYDNLIKTGRMSKIAGILATHLGIRAVAVSNDGEIEVVKKPRGEKHAIAAMAEIMAERKNVCGKKVVISHCRNFEGAQSAKKLIEERFSPAEVYIYECKGLTSFYTMENGLIIGY